MNTRIVIPYFTLLLMISFASVNAVLFTPALPDIAHYFSITEGQAQLTITWFLIGYAFGQLIYGPLSNRFGRKRALYIGILLQIISSFLCVLSAWVHLYTLLVFGRLLLALGSGVGLKMTFTLVSETQTPEEGSRTLSYLMIAFAITPGLAVATGGFLITYFLWTSTFYAGILYGFVLLILVTRLPETKLTLDFEAFSLSHLFNAYAEQFQNISLVVGGLLMGCATCFVYVFAAIAPFIAMNLLHMRADYYGLSNFIPSIGLVFGSLMSARLTKKYSLATIIPWGITIALIGSFLMIVFSLLTDSAIMIIFFPMMICYVGLSFVFANASSLALKHVTDKAHGSAVMNFINMGLTTMVVLSIGLIPVHTLLLPLVFISICLAMMLLYRFAMRESRSP